MLHRIAAIQMTSSEDVGANLTAAGHFLQQARAQGAELIVLPEMFALMGMDQQAKVKHAEKIGQGVIQDFLAKQAADLKVWIVGGTIPISIEHSDKVTATCLVFNDKGERVARYDKIHLFDVTITSTQEKHFESQVIDPGKKVVVVETPVGRLGLAVCYDVRFPEMFRKMHAENVEIIALPSAFTFTTGSAHWDVLVRARAIENLSYVVAACQGGVHRNGRKTYGHSVIVDPWGVVKASLDLEPGIIMSEIDLGYLKKIRQDFPALMHKSLLEL